jgi:hypothetical protein
MQEIEVMLDHAMVMRRITSILTFPSQSLQAKAAPLPPRRV